MDKLDMRSGNLVDGNIDKIAKLFPNCITEGKNEEGEVVRLVDFDLLKQELSKEIVEGNDERYTLNWAGKKQAILTANSPINATLRPCKEESVGKDGTAGGFDSENLYIEGDNLDVLKLLRETYLGKVKMIYIDPPYNTGNDFVYEDDFATSTEEYLQNSKSYDEQGNRMFQNNESHGRFHSDWLSMMYARIKLARDLLTDDGAIFISIDDNEQENLKKLCNEVFGENNFVGEVIRKTKSMTGDDGCGFNLQHESLYIYSKNKENLLLEGDDKDYSGYLNPDNDPNGDWCSADPSAKSGGETTYFGIENPYTKKIDYPPVGRYWAFSKSTLQEYIKSGKLKFKEQHRDNERGFIFKRYKKDASSLKNPLNSLFADSNDYMNQKATTELVKLFNGSYFSYPKPVDFIKYLIKSIAKQNDIVFDFFSGSSTTAHAVIQLNAEDGGNRKFIMVQLPEPCDKKSEAYKAGYKNICEIGKERIRRAGKKMVSEHLDKFVEDVVEKTKAFKDNKEIKKLIISKEMEKEVNKPKLDIGFRVLKLDSSCMKDVYYAPSEMTQGLLFGLEDNIKEDRTAEDLLFQVMLDMGVVLSSRVEERKLRIENGKCTIINNEKFSKLNTSDKQQVKTIYIVGEYSEGDSPNLVCCFDNNLTDEVVTEIAKMQPLYAVFRDSSMSTDSVAVNFDQIFETYSPTTTRKVL